MNDPFVRTLAPATVVLRIVFAVLAGSLIGLERLLNHKQASLKTNTLVALGSCVFGLIATDSYFLPSWSASQFSIGVITGIGFLGSGIMMHNSNQLQGVNSAATIWVSAGIGLACGLGEGAIATWSLIACLGVQYLHRWIERHLGPG